MKHKETKETKETKNGSQKQSSVTIMVRALEGSSFIVNRASFLSVNPIVRFASFVSFVSFVSFC